MSDPVVKLKNGSVRGIVSNDYKGNSYYSFYAIPYAEPPVGELRFKPPIPAKPWKGIIDGSKPGNKCISQDLTNLSGLKFSGSEDCLFVNVFTHKIPKENEAEYKPVLFWIHGGAFTMGSGNLFGNSNNIMSEDVVMVSFNYRLGVLGFLSLENPDLGVTGNAGMKDMILALKWVQENITAFNGNPNNVTIFGESAGGAAVHYLLLSPLSEGLFHRAIAQSGNALNHWTVGRRCAKELVEKLGCESTDEKEMLEFLRSIPVEKLWVGSQQVTDDFTDASTVRPFSPVVENSNSEEAFLREEPVELLKKGQFIKVPFMTGYTKTEGMLVAFFAKPAQAPVYVTDFERVIPHPLKICKESDTSKGLIQKIKKFYYGDEDPSDENIDKTFDLYTDISFLHGMIISIRKQLQTSSPIYLYRFSFESPKTPVTEALFGSYKGTCHGEDLQYIFNTFRTHDIVPGTKEENIAMYFIKLWTNFARYGNPNPPSKDPYIPIHWKPVEEDVMNYLDIGDYLVAGTVLPESNRIQFWDNIFSERSKL